MKSVRERVIPKVTALAPWFGSNRTLAPQVGELLNGCRWVGVPFAGSMTELIYIDAPTLVVSDLHRHVINLATVAADEADHTSPDESLVNPQSPQGGKRECDMATITIPDDEMERMQKIADATSEMICARTTFHLPWEATAEDFIAKLSNLGATPAMMRLTDFGFVKWPNHPPMVRVTFTRSTK